MPFLPNCSTVYHGRSCAANRNCEFELVICPVAFYNGFINVRVLAGIVGLVPLFLMIKNMKAPLDALMGSYWGHFCYSFIVVLYCVTLWPLVIKACTKAE